MKQHQLRSCNASSANISGISALRLHTSGVSPHLRLRPSRLYLLNSYPLLPTPPTFASDLRFYTS